ncbi:MAG: molybdopterin cofactor-binding domain-containing protein [Tistlia sp.]|uniref:xanthine dehydrogenase family protein molybdopterin-binding subunit n=1 Tax=Tistlia sp. TaxID=3057121 RepID=UPI0034A1E802
MAQAVGESMLRVEDPALLTGTARFADDLPVAAGTLYAVVVRSSEAHAEILTLDTAEALAMPGVEAVITGEEVARISDPLLAAVKRPEGYCLAIGRLRYVGEPLAIVVARSRYEAEDAAELVRLETRPLPPLLDPVAAAEEGAAAIHPEVGSNVVHDRRFRYGDPEAVLGAADRVIEMTVDYPRVLPCPIEGYVVVADYRAGDGIYDVLANFQGPYGLHTVMARALRVPGNRLRLRTPPCSGGSFGAKLAIFTNIVMMCLASRVTGKPVKWVEDRLEHLVASGSGPNRVTRLRAAVTGEGVVEALELDQLEDYGAWMRAPMPGPLYRMHGASSGAYRLRHLAIRNRVVLTNKVPASLVRGFGGPQLYFALERLMQRIAVELALDPLEVVRRNLIPAGSFPYRAPAGALYDSGDYQAAVERAVEEGGLAELRRRRVEARAAGRLYGIGFAAVVEPGMSNMGYLSTLLSPEQRARSGPKDGAIASATVEIDATGSVSVTADSVPQGQGHRTVLAQIVGEVLGLPPEDIAVAAEHDTGREAWSVAAGNYSSRFAGATASAAHLAATRLRDRMARLASQKLNAEPEQLVFEGGRIFARGNPDNAAAFYRVAGSLHWSPGSLPEGMPPSLRETAHWSPPELAPPTEADEINTSLTYGFVFDFCGVEIDRSTGRLTIDRYVTMHDAGRLLHPAIAEGQIVGSYVQALGASLYEDYAYGSDGSLLAGTFADYLLPTAPEVRDPLVLHLETPSPFTRLGAKGLGEGNNMSTPVCIANAVADALDLAEVRLPITEDRINAWLSGAEPPRPERPGAAARATPERRARPAALSGRNSYLIAADRAAVWKRLLDPDALAAVIPGCRRFEQQGERRYLAEAVVRVGPIRGAFTARLELCDLEEPESLRILGEAQGALGAARGEGRLLLVEEGAGTRIDYQYDIDLSGKISSVGSRLLEGASGLLIRQFLAGFARQLETAEGPGAAPAGRSPWRRLLARLGLGR